MVHVVRLWDNKETSVATEFQTSGDGDLLVFQSDVGGRLILKEELLRIIVIVR